MESRFAGAADVGQRRRRRLASSDCDDIVITEALAVPKFRVQGVQSGGVDEQLLRRAISPRLWKHLLLLFLLFAACGLLAYSRHDSSVSTFSPFLADVSRGVCGVLLLLSAQFSLAIGWLRARSDVDYQGRYRWWKWMAVWLGMGALLLLTNSAGTLPILASRLLQPLTGQIQAARYAVVLVPAIVCSLVVLAKVLPDMKRCLGSQCLLIAGVMFLVVRLMLDYGSSSPHIEAVWLESMTLATCCFFFASMLVHCWFVGYVSNDPPVPRRGVGSSQPTHDSEESHPSSTAASEEATPEIVETVESAKSGPTPEIKSEIQEQTSGETEQPTRKARTKRKGSRKSRRRSAA